MHDPHRTRAPRVTGFQSVRFAVGNLHRGSKDYQRLLGSPPVSADAFQLDNVRVALSPLEKTSLEVEGLLEFSLASERSGAYLVGAPNSLDATILEDLVFQREAAVPVRVQPLQPAPSEVQGLDHLVIRSKDVDATAQFYGEVLGLRILFDREFPDWNVRLCMCRVGDAVLEIAGRLGDANKAQDQEVPEDEMAPRDRLWGITWRVGDADAARSRLQALGVDVSEVRPGRRPGTRVFTVRSGTCGVPTLMIQLQ